MKKPMKAAPPKVQAGLNSGKREGGENDIATLVMDGLTHTYFFNRASINVDDFAQLQVLEGIENAHPA